MSKKDVIYNIPNQLKNNLDFFSKCLDKSGCSKCDERDKEHFTIVANELQITNLIEWLDLEANKIKEQTIHIQNNIKAIKEILLQKNKT